MSQIDNNELIIRLSFVFYSSWFSMLKNQPDEVRLKMYDAIMKYAFEGEVPNDPLIQMPFYLIKDQIDRDEEAYRAKCEKNKKIAQEREQKRREQATSNTNVNERAGVNTSVTNNDNGDGDGNGNKNGNDNGNGTIVVSVAGATTLSQRKEKFASSLLPYVPTYGQEMVQAFLDYWTEPNKSQTKMRFEMEKTWDINRRMKKWAENDYKFNTNTPNNTNNGTHNIKTADARQAEAMDVINNILNRNK